MGMKRKLRIAYAKRFWPLHIHTEALYEDRVWESVKAFVLSGAAGRKRAVWFLLTPANYDYTVSTIGCNMSRAEQERRLKERYRWLKENGQELHLHVHCMYNPELFGRHGVEPRFRRLIADALKWLRGIGIEPKLFAFGWFSSNKAMRDFVEGLGMRIDGEFEGNYITHDYEIGALYGDKIKR